MRSTTAFAYWTAITALPVSVSAFQPPPLPAEQGPKVINVQKIKDNLYVLKGGGENASVFITENHGVVVVDTKNPG